MIRDADLNDLREIAILHTESFEGHFLPKLGLKLLVKYYEEFIDEKNIFIVNVDENNRINGLVLGTPNSAVGRNRFIMNNKIGLSLRVLLLCFILDKDTWVRLLGFIRSFFNKENNKVIKHRKPHKKTISLLSICVSQDAKGKGVSKALIQEFEHRLTKLGYEGYTTTVYKTNDRANQFYKNIKMDIYKETKREYGYIKQIIN
jgi:ribosomal protein S18 acetylase RimI-like enzyme